jgi:hypothetical protein
VGVAGATPDPAGRANVCSPQHRYGGITCINGLLTANYDYGLRDCTDGTSNTMIVAEQSGVIGTADIRANYYGGWGGFTIQMSAASGDSMANLPSWTSTTDTWGTGITTVRYAPNPTSSPGGGADEVYDMNTALTSFHKGGIHVLMTDGAVRFVSDNINFGTLANLASKDDNVVLGEF